MACPAATVRLRLSEGTSITFIGDEPLIFSQGRHALYELNRIAGYIGCRLEEGVDFAQLAREIGDRGLDRPEVMLRGVLADWSHAGLIQACDAPPCSEALLEQTVSVGGLRVLLRYHDEALARRVAALFVHLEADPGACDVAYDLWSTDGLALLSRNGGPASVLDPRQAGPVVKARIAEEALNDTRDLLALHAGCLIRDGRALLLTGRPGAGKTTLTSRLLDAGFAYAGDDITMLSADGKVRGLPLLPSIKSGAWRLLEPVYGDIARLPIHVRPDGRRVRFPSPRVTAEGTAVEARWIVKLQRKRGRSARLAPLPPALAIKHLVTEASSHTHEIGRAALDTLVRAVTAARCYELHYADLNEAASSLQTLCADEAA